MVGLVIGIINVLLWFAPWFSWTQEFMGQTQELYQTGLHIGGIAYAILVVSIVYAVVSYQKNKQLQLVFAILQLVLVGIIAMLGGSLAWGMAGLILMSIIAIITIIVENGFQELMPTKDDDKEKIDTQS